MVLKNSNSKASLQAQADLCCAAYRYIGTVLDEFSADCVLLAIHENIPQSSRDEALLKLIESGEIIQTFYPEQLSTNRSQPPKYKLIKK